MTIAGRPERVAVARAFRGGSVFGRQHPAGETAVLLLSELVTNSVRHGACGLPGRTVTVQSCVPHGTVYRMVSDVYDKLEHELRRGVVVVAVLSQLRTLRYGYELRQFLVENGLPIEEGTLYPLLRRLEAQGVLSSEWRTTQGAPRRYYVLSAEGVDLCQRLTASWRGLNKTMDHLLEGERRDDR